MRESVARDPNPHRRPRSQRKWGEALLSDQLAPRKGSCTLFGGVHLLGGEGHRGANP
jgi:hypothetical protein